MATVYNLERVTGVDDRLSWFLAGWQVHGPFEIVIPPDGGVRKDAARQAVFYAQKTSNAATLADTPHGRAGAIDICPYGPTPLTRKGSTVFVLGPQYPENLPPHLQAECVAKFRRIGAIAKRLGFVWGGDWARPDMPHIEVPDWRLLPFPPPTAPGGFRAV
jgi:D-alanyl-D-alanine carboxypeptidase